jgi:hypothetical protein
VLNAVVGAIFEHHHVILLLALLLSMVIWVKVHYGGCFGQEMNYYFGTFCIILGVVFYDFI